MRGELGRVLVTDIFGLTPAFEQFANAVPGVTAVVDPYGGERFQFACEADAYAHFSTQVGVARYTALLADHIGRCRGRVSLIGFSVGGSAAWGLEGDAISGRVSGALCFYSAQVRHNVGRAPPFPVHLVLPEREPHFDVTDMAKQASLHSGVKVTQTPWPHGFMNPLSTGFTLDAFDYTVSVLGALSTARCATELELGQKYRKKIGIFGPFG